MDDITDTQLFEWISLYANRIDALLAEIGQRYPAVPYWQIARDEFQRGHNTTAFHEAELGKWLRSA